MDRERAINIEQRRDDERTLNLFNLQEICDLCEVAPSDRRIEKSMLREALTRSMLAAIAELGKGGRKDRSALLSWLHAFRMFLNHEHPNIDVQLYEQPLEVLSSVFINLQGGHVDPLCQPSQKGGRPEGPILHRKFKNKCVAASELFYKLARIDPGMRSSSSRSIIDKKVARLASSRAKMIRISVSGTGVAEWRKTSRAAVAGGNANTRAALLLYELELAQLIRTLQNTETAFARFIAGD